jgi:hypothetical protein
MKAEILLEFVSGTLTLALSHGKLWEREQSYLTVKRK